MVVEPVCAECKCAEGHLPECSTREWVCPRCKGASPSPEKRCYACWPQAPVELSVIVKRAGRSCGSHWVLTSLLTGAENSGRTSRVVMLAVQAALNGHVPVLVVCGRREGDGSNFLNLLRQVLDSCGLLETLRLQIHAVGLDQLSEMMRGRPDWFVLMDNSSLETRQAAAASVLSGPPSAPLSATT